MVRIPTGVGQRIQPVVWNRSKGLPSVADAVHICRDSREFTTCDDTVQVRLISSSHIALNSLPL